MAVGTTRNYARTEGEGVALATSVATGTVLNKPPWAEVAEIVMSANGVKYAFCPRIRKAWFFNGSTYADSTAAVEDKNLATHLGPDAMTSSGFVYVGADDPFRGINVTMDGSNKNSNSSTMTVSYYNGSSWASASASDGSASGGATLAQSGLITWTVPTDWERVAVNGLNLDFWVRISVNNTLSATVEIEEMSLLYRNTNYAQHNGTATLDLSWNNDLVGGLELLSTASTPTAHIKYYGN
jgi:hypothetical protein